MNHFSSVSWLTHISTQREETGERNPRFQSWQTVIWFCVAIFGRRLSPFSFSFSVQAIRGCRCVAVLLIIVYDAEDRHLSETKIASIIIFSFASVFAVSNRHWRQRQHTQQRRRRHGRALIERKPEKANFDFKPRRALLLLGESCRRLSTLLVWVVISLTNARTVFLWAK